jgi:ElaB/YqjD/DUF883 family membrane-anchored ribosome-binding protein
MSNNSALDASHGLIEHAAQSAEAAIHSTQHMAGAAVDGLSNALQTARKQVSSSAHQASDRTVAYIREEPVKSMLIAAATGAALMALARVISQPHHSR